MITRGLFPLAGTIIWKSAISRPVIGGVIVGMSILRRYSARHVATLWHLRGVRAHRI